MKNILLTTICLATVATYASDKKPTNTKRPNILFCISDDQKKLNPPYTGISDIDYAGNFDDFLQGRKSDQPFFFWYGAKEPHRAFEEGSGQKEGKSETGVNVPAYLPDHTVIKNDLLDYAVEIEWYDQQLGKILRKLESIGELENTLIIVTSDNGMSFPRAKANCYDAGIHVPLAISWGKQIPSGQVADELISAIDLAPTILEVAGVQFNGDLPMSGESKLKQLCSPKYPNQKSGAEIFAGRERHSSARFENRGYPQRAIRTDKYLYIKNYHPEYWPSGDPQVYLKDGSLGEMHGAYMDIDDCPTLRLYQKYNVVDSVIAPYFLAATAKRPTIELYDIQVDQACMINLAGNPKYRNIQKQLSGRLASHLKATGDTRKIGPNPEIWETYPRLRGEIRIFPNENKN